MKPKARALTVEEITIKSPNQDPKFNGTGYGITDGRKWYFYSYKHKQTAEHVMKNITPDVVDVNIGYPAPVVIRNM